MIIHDKVEQGSKEWFDLRAGRFTASEAETIKVDGKGLETLVYQKAAYRMTGELPPTYSTPAMEWGKQYEADARNCYAEINGIEVKEVGFIEHNEYVGCSPDGLVGEDGLIEIKCKQPHNHLYAAVNEWVDPKHKLQMQFQLLVTGRKWCDYVCYCPLFKNPIWTKRFVPDAKVFAELKNGIEHGTDLIQKIIRNYEVMFL